MAKHNVKRIAAEPRSRSTDEWDKAWLPPVLERIGKAARLGRDALFASSSTLAYWGGLAGIIGSILWAILFVAFQSQALMSDWPHEFEPVSDWFAFSFASWGYTELLVVPILLFLFCLVAIFIDQEKRLVTGTWLCRTGFILANLGLISVMMFTLNEHWLSLWYNKSDLIVDFVVPDRFYVGSLLLQWVGVTSPSFMLAGIGLALFGLAAIRAKALPIWTAMWLVVSSLAVFLIPTGLILFAPGEQSYSLLYGSGIFLVTMLAFGGAWAILGYALLRGRTRDHSQQPYPFPRSL